MADEGGGKDELGLELPVYRIKKVIEKYAPTAAPDTEAAMALAKATELFLERMVELSVQPHMEGGAKRYSLLYDHVASTVATWSACDFLREQVPQRVKGSVAKEMLRAAQQAAETSAEGTA